LFCYAAQSVFPAVDFAVDRFPTSGLTQSLGHDLPGGYIPGQHDFLPIQVPYLRGQVLLVVFVGYAPADRGPTAGKVPDVVVTFCHTEFSQIVLYFIAIKHIVTAVLLHYDIVFQSVKVRGQQAF
jgi:hypothetical protein